MARVLAVVNQKGGVGKTTTSVNLAAALAQAGRRVLLVDLDPQGNATMGSGIDKRTAGRTVYHVLLGLSELAAARVRLERAAFDLLPANRDLAGAEVELVALEGRETRLKRAVEQLIKVLPNVRQQVLPGQTHNVKAAVLVPALVQFFKE